MNLVAIGTFLSELRKEQGLTQEQLGEKVGVTNKTISRWETGTYLPPADALLIMSDLFSVSINEILSGKRLSAEEYKEAAEENLAQTIKASSFTLKDKIAFYNKKWLKEHLTVLCLLGIAILALLIAGIVLCKPWLSYASVLLLILAHGWRNNTMMAYIERNAYDGSGN